MAALRLCTAKSCSHCWRSTSGYGVMSFRVKQATTSTGALVNCSMDACADAVQVGFGVPSFLRSCCHAVAIASARLRFAGLSIRTMNLQGWALCAEGADVAASRISHRTSWGTGRWRYFLMLRRFLIASVMWDIKGQLFNGTLFF